MAIQFPTNTYRIDKENQRIVGMIDGADAYWQFCRKALATDKESWFYYDENYGLRNKQRYVGHDREWIEAHWQKDVVECVGTDFRTVKVDNFEFEEITPGKLHCKCVIWSIYGARPFDTTINI